MSDKRTPHFDRQTFSRVLVDHHQQPKLATILGPIRHKAVRPRMILVAGTVTHATVLASKGDAHVFRSPSSHAALAIDKCGQIRNEDVDEPANASRAVPPVHHPPDAIGIAGCCVVAPEHGRPDAPYLFLPLNGYARRIPCFGDVQGLAVSIGGLLEDLHIESLLGNHLLQPCVLFLQSFQLLRHLWFHTTVLLPPAIIRLFGDFRKRIPAMCRPRAPSCPYRFQHRLYGVRQRSDPLCDVSEAF